MKKKMGYKEFCCFAGKIFPGIWIAFRFDPTDQLNPPPLGCLPEKFEGSPFLTDCEFFVGNRID